MLRPSLLACPSCSCHVRAHATECPHCGFAPLGGSGWTRERTAVAVAMGLAMSVAGGCGDVVVGTGGAGGTGATGSTTNTSTHGSTTQASTSYSAIAAYGVAASSGSSGG